MPITSPGAATTFHDSFRFIVQIEGVTRAKFRSVSEITMTHEDIDHWEGGRAIAYKSPGRVTVDDVTLERGVIDNDDDLYFWFITTTDVNVDSPLGAGIGTGLGLDDEAYKRDVDIVQLKRDGTPRKRIRLVNAYPKTVTLGSMNNEEDAKTIESVVLRYDYPRVIPVQ
jgi:phage tail-like protein